jgi:hypothetical protein
MNSVGSASGITGHKNQVQSIRLDYAGEQLVTCGFDDMLKFISLRDFKYSKEVKLDSQPQGVDVNLNGLVAVACINKLVVLRGSEPVASLSLAYDATCVAITRNKNFISVGGKVCFLFLFFYEVE